MHTDPSNVLYIDAVQFATFPPPHAPSRPPWRPTQARLQRRRRRHLHRQQQQMAITCTAKSETFSALQCSGPFSAIFSRDALYDKADINLRQSICNSRLLELGHVWTCVQSSREAADASSRARRCGRRRARHASACFHVWRGWWRWW